MNKVFVFAVFAVFAGGFALVCITNGKVTSTVDSRNGAQPLVTRWAKDVSPESVWPEYPRPHLVRKSWASLNGEWDLAITDINNDQPKTYSTKILVPFCLESHLGGVSCDLAPTQRAWYRRTFEIAHDWRDQNLLLHFGAVDWHAEVWVNGSRVGEHRGGYDPFTFDITDLVNENGENVIVVGVTDPTDSGNQPRGKQNLTPDGIWYTPVSGIWQTVWLEPVPNSYIEDLVVTPNLEESTVSVVANVNGSFTDAVLKITARGGENLHLNASGPANKPVVFSIDNARAWSPDDPFLYDLDVSVIKGGETIDRVSSYFGMRSIRLGPDLNGHTRILFNGEPLFQLGPLDQGYWPDGLYTAPTDEALRYDLEIAKRLGFNMIRKHVKVEPARWYYWCDRLGLLVWQDMPNGDEHAPWPADGLEVQRSEESAEQFFAEFRSVVNSLKNFPSIVVWVPFNEGWGQFRTADVTDQLLEYDPTRLVISASGGNDFGCGHINDDHFYPGPGSPPAEPGRAAVLGEFGGLGLPLTGHTWQQEANWGYRNYKSQKEFESAYLDLVEKLRPLVESHLSAAVYTQLTDVEIEVNGLLTYDRQVIKANESEFRTANESLYAPLAPRTDPQLTTASVLAWWRFEKGDVGQVVSDLSNRMGAIAAHDLSGRNNHMFAFSADHAPSIGQSVAKRSIGLPGIENARCLDDTAPPANQAATRDLYTNPEISRTHMDMVDRFPFSDWTIEASFRLTEADDRQVVLSKEEDRGGVKLPLFQLGVSGSPLAIVVEMIDEAGKKAVVRSGPIRDLNEWRHVAVTCEEGVVRLYIAPDDNFRGYQLVGTTNIEGSLAKRPGTWLVGRGCESGKMGRDFVGWIDEVRISTKALDPAQFLFARPVLSSRNARTQTLATEREEKL